MVADIWGREHGVKLKAYKQYDPADIQAHFVGQEQ